MKLSLIQMDIAWKDRKKNHDRALSFIKRAEEEGCDLIVFPEMFDTGFSMDIHALGDGSGTDSLLSEAARRHGLYIIAGFAVRKRGSHRGKQSFPLCTKNNVEGKARNMAVVYDRGGKAIARYSKIHPFSYMGEDRFFIAGERPVLFEINGIPSSVFICYDLRFPEVFRKVADSVHLIFVIANWPSSRVDHWKTLLRARAIENQCFVTGVNRIGRDGNAIDYPGCSSIYDPSGTELLSGNSREEFLVAEIDPSEVERVRREFPFLKDRKV
jgi:predicted amidohydrolase